MKISAKQYALALQEATDGQTPGRCRAIIASWLRLIATNRDWHRLEQILAEVNIVWQQAEGLAEATAVSKHPLSPQLLQQLTDYLKKLTGAKKIAWQTEIDKQLLGGVIVRCQDQVIDASLNQALARLKNNLAN